MDIEKRAKEMTMWLFKPADKLAIVKKVMRYAEKKCFGLGTIVVMVDAVGKDDLNDGRMVIQRNMSDDDALKYLEQAVAFMRWHIEEQEA